MFQFSGNVFFLNSDLLQNNLYEFLFLKMSLKWLWSDPKMMCFIYKIAKKKLIFKIV